MEPQRLTDFASAGRVVLEGVVLDDDRAPEGRREVADWLVARATVGLCAAQSGVIQRALELTAEYAKSRVAFGRPIGSFQAVTQRLADAFVDVEAVGSPCGRPPGCSLPGRPADAAVATAKFWAAEAGH